MQRQNKQCAFARDTEADLQSLAHLSHAHEDSVTTGQRHKKETPTIARVTTCSERHVSARVISTFSLNRWLSTHRLGLRSQRFRHFASALSTTALPALPTLRECSVHLPRTTASASKGWIPDHCVTKEQQLHWRVSEPSKLHRHCCTSHKSGQGPCSPKPILN